MHQRLPTTAVRVALAVGSIVFASAVARPAQVGVQTGPNSTVSLEQLRVWVTAVELHAPGADDPPTRAFRSWSQRDLEAVTDLDGPRQALARAWTTRLRTGRALPITFAGRDYPFLEFQAALGVTSEEARAGDLNALLRRAALLHADIALLHPDEDALRQSLTPTGKERLRVKIRDGREEAVSSGAGSSWACSRNSGSATWSPTPRAA
jgi:hypothetical protein